MARKHQHNTKKITVSLGEFLNNYNTTRTIAEPTVESRVRDLVSDELFAATLQEEEDFEYAKSLNAIVPMNLRSFVPQTITSEAESEQINIDIKFKTRNEHIIHAKSTSGGLVARPWRRTGHLLPETKTTWVMRE